MMHKCTTCEKIVHNLCARIDEDGSGIGNEVWRFCRTCDAETTGGGGTTDGNEKQGATGSSSGKRKATKGAAQASTVPAVATPGTEASIMAPVATLAERSLEAPYPGIKHLVLKPPKSKSIWWKYFYVFKPAHPTNIDNNLGGRASCNICGADFKLSDGSPTALKRHMYNCHRELAVLLDAEHAPAVTRTKCVPSISSRNRVSLITAWQASGKKVKLTPTEARANVGRQIALWTALSNQSIREVTSEPFRRMLKVVRVNSSALSEDDLNFGANFISTEVARLEHELKALMKERLKGKICIGTTDHWTSRANESYASLTASFVEDFQLVTLTLEVHLFKGSSKSDALIVDYAQRWNEWGKDLKTDIPFNVTDTEAKMNKFGMELAQNFGSEHMYCHDHDLQLVANVAFKVEFFGDQNNGDESELLMKARALVACFTSSSQKERDLKEAQVLLYPGLTFEKALKAIQDVVTRWWSTYSMVLRLLQLKPAIELLVQQKKLEATKNLSEAEWSVLTQIMLVLKPLASAQKTLEGAKYVTISLLPLILTEIKQRLELVAHVVDEDIAECVKKCAADMLEIFETRFGDLERPFQETVKRGYRNRQVGLNKAVFFAYILDPRFKNVATLQLARGEGEMFYQSLLKKMVSNETAFQIKRGAEGTGELADKGDSPPSAPSSPPSKRHRSSQAHYGGFVEENDFVSLLSQFDKRNLAAEMYEAGNIAPLAEHDIKYHCERELADYRKEKGMRLHADESTRSYNDPFIWWKIMHERFPILWRLAQIYLAIPATSAASESAFSHAGNVVTPDRSNLKPETVTALLFLNRNGGIMLA
jgi:hypothetical protein